MSNKFKKILSILSMSTLIFGSASSLNAIQMIGTNGTGGFVSEPVPDILSDFERANTLLVFQNGTDSTQSSNLFLTPIVFQDNRDQNLVKMVGFVLGHELNVEGNINVKIINCNDSRIQFLSGATRFYRTFKIRYYPS